MVKIRYKDKEYSFKNGSILRDAALKLEPDKEVILAMVDGKLAELANRLKDGTELRMLTTADYIGYQTYRRTASMILVKAAREVLGDGNDTDVIVDFSISTGFYCRLAGDRKITKAAIKKIKTRMKEIIDADIPIKKESMPIDEAIALFAKQNMYDKVKLLNYRRASTVNVYEIDGFKDYNYGYVSYSTGQIRFWDIVPYKDGFILNFPEKGVWKQPGPYEPYDRLFEVMNGSSEWGRSLGLDTVGDLDEAIAAGRANDIVLMQEAFQEKKIGEIAQKISEKQGCRVILIAGPTSSGKTTFSHRLSLQLRALGIKAHPLACDNYFVNREDTPVDADGRLDYESLRAIDTKKLNEDITGLLKGDTVEIPVFNFVSGKREAIGTPMRLMDDEVLVMEGIHCLNDALTYSLDAGSKFKIYISALTMMNVDKHNRIATTDGRLIRRIVRDAAKRGADARKTIGMWDIVRRGEKANIFPYQEGADVMFDSSLIYELAALKQYAEPLLFNVPKDSPEYPEAKRLLKFLDYFLGISTEHIPHNSVLREFIGGSYFNV
ncbi:MAG: nucleoside kinase [Lachnospiraceae bacterium]|nr:nucleoside kinase [Lachnospiraceae bacterium]